MSAGSQSEGVVSCRELRPLERRQIIPRASEQAWQRSTAAPALRLDLVPLAGTHCAAGGCRDGLQVTR